MTQLICPICRHDQIICFLQSDNVPVLNNILCESEKAAKAFPVGQLDMCGCARCGFAWNELYDESKVVYSENYENTQSNSRFFVEYVRDLCQKIVERTSLSSIIEVGCGQGFFLESLERYMAGRLLCAIGFDPALREEKKQGALKLVKSVASNSLVPKEIPLPMVLLTRHLIEHIATPVKFVDSLLNMMPMTSYVILETPSLGWILDNRSFFDFYYEHCSMFTADALSFLFSDIGLCVDSISTSFGGQYLLGIASRSPRKSKMTKSINYASIFEDFSKEAFQCMQDWRTKLSNWSTQGKRVAIWGAGSKGVMFVNLLLKSNNIASVIDINPRKQGVFLPVSGLPVCSVECAKSRGIDTVIVMNPNYLNEIEQICAGVDFFPELFLA